MAQRDVTSRRNGREPHAQGGAPAPEPTSAKARPREETGHAALMEALREPDRSAALFAKVCFLARARYGIRPQDAEDIFHDAIVTYLNVHERYPPRDNHFGILVGIFHKKALEFLGSKERDGRVARRFVMRLQADRPAVARGEDPRGPTVDHVVRDEDASLIRGVLRTLSDEAREMVLTLAEGRRTRLELIDELGVNRNTFDTRLRSIRLKLRRALEAAGVM